MSNSQIPERMACFFNKRVSDYEEHMKESYTYHAEKLQLAEQFDATNDPVRILDLGCGTGLEIEYILPRTPNAKFICIDLAESMLEHLKSKYRDVLNQIDVIKASYFDYDFGYDQNDYVVASATMHHWLHDEKLSLYRRIFDSLKPGGKFINDDYMVREDEEKRALERYISMRDSNALEDGESYHIDIPCSVKTETRILYDAGFQKVKVVYEYHDERHSNALVVAFKEPH